MQLRMQSSASSAFIRSSLSVHNPPLLAAREHDGGGAGEGRAAKACPSPEPSVLSSTFTSAHDALVKEQVRKGQLPPSALQQSQQVCGVLTGKASWGAR